MEQIKKRLTDNLREYVKAIIEKYGKYIEKEKLLKLNNINDFNDIIKIHDYGSVNAYATNDDIFMPLCADRLLKIASKIPGYGINKNHQSYNSDTLINNNNNFIDYIFHVFLSGTDVEGYFDDMLLHETMHFCGSGGQTALKEGINELLTRKLALEKGFKTNGCGYPKEVQIAVMLQNIFGEDIINQIAFINSEQQICMFLANALNFDAADLYLIISREMEKEFHKKYYADFNTYDGIAGIIKKTLNYEKIDYSNIYEILSNYKQNHQVTGEYNVKNK